MNGRKAKAIRRAARQQAVQLIEAGWKMKKRQLVREPGNSGTAINHPDSFRGYLRTIKRLVKQGRIQVDAKV